MTSIKTLIFNGSPRKNGDTVSLLRIFTEHLDGDHLIVNTYNGEISPCMDCRFCRTHEGCAIHDGMTEVYDYLETCDNILIVSPMYFSELTGRMLDVGSRLQTYFSATQFRGESPVLKPKRGGVILVGGGSGAPEKAYQTAVLLLHYMNAFDIHPLVGSFHTDRLPAAEDAAAVSQIRQMADFFNISG